MTVSIFQAQRGDEILQGTAHELSLILGIDPHDIRAHARIGEKSRTRSGWSFVIVARGTGMLPQSFDELVFVATNPREDPIVGPAEEIAALTGMAEGKIYRLWNSGEVSREGWRIRRVIEKEAVI